MTHPFNRTVRQIKRHLAKGAQRYVHYQRVKRGIKTSHGVITNPRLGPLLHQGRKPRQK